jgi:hypothetical protein
MIEIRLKKYRLFLTENELQSLLARDPDLWATAIRRGKAVLRARAAARRQGGGTRGR